MNSDLYPASYYLGGGASNYTNYGDDPGWVPTALALRGALNPHFNSPTVLEVGCATGWFVKAARTLGLDAYGIDVSEWAVSHPAPGVGQFLGQMSVTDLLDSTDPLVNTTFDAVVSWEMLEHVPEDQVETALDNMLSVTHFDGLWVHRIALEESAHEHHAHDDATHFTVKPREWWLEKFEDVSDARLKRDLDVEAAFDAAFEGRDWSGRFFAYRF